jgi:hypothetical protein
MLMIKKPKNLEFEPVHPKNVLLASVVHVVNGKFFVEMSKPSLPECPLQDFSQPEFCMDGQI